MNAVRGMGTHSAAEAPNPSRTEMSFTSPKTGGAGRRVATTCGLALCLAACGSAASLGSVAPSQPAGSGEPVYLLTGVAPNSCYAGGESNSGIGGELLPDPNFGTAIGDTPIMWPVGYTARHAEAEIEVLDGQGSVKAITGRMYHISKAPLNNFPLAPSFDPAPPANYFPAAANCLTANSPWAFIDCTTAASATGAPLSSDSKSYTAIGEAKLYCGLWTPPPPPTPSQQ
jgi:hypothetical protein